MGGGVGSTTAEVSDIVVIDSKVGMQVMSVAGGHVEVKDSIMYGNKDMLNLDCPLGGGCAACFRRHGLMIPTFASHTLEVLLAPMKISKMYELGGSWGTSLFKNLKFIGWDGKRNNCGGS